MSEQTRTIINCDECGARDVYPGHRCLPESTEPFRPWLMRQIDACARRSVEDDRKKSREYHGQTRILLQGILAEYDRREAAAVSSAPPLRIGESVTATFGTVNDLAAQFPMVRRETVPPAPATPQRARQLLRCECGHLQIEHALRGLGECHAITSGLDECQCCRFENGRQEAAALPVREDAPPPGGVRSAENDDDALTRRDTSDD